MHPHILIKIKLLRTFYIIVAFQRITSDIVYLGIPGLIWKSTVMQISVMVDFPAVIKVRNTYLNDIRIPNCIQSFKSHNIQNPA